MQQPREVRMSAGLKRVIATWMLLGRCLTHEQHTLSRVRLRFKPSAHTSLYTHATRAGYGLTCLVWL